MSVRQKLKLENNGLLNLYSKMQQLLCTFFNRCSHGYPIGKVVIDPINFNFTFVTIGAATLFFSRLSSGMADNKRKCIWQSSFETFDLKSLTSEATPSATQIFKRSYKTSNNPGL